MSVRIYQLARQLNLENKKVIELLQKKGMNVKSPSSTIPNVYAEEFIKEFSGDKKTEQKQILPEAANKQKTDKSKKVMESVKEAQKSVQRLEK